MTEINFNGSKTYTEMWYRIHSSEQHTVCGLMFVTILRDPGHCCLGVSDERNWISYSFLKAFCLSSSRHNHASDCRNICCNWSGRWIGLIPKMTDLFQGELGCKVQRNILHWFILYAVYHLNMFLLTLLCCQNKWMNEYDFYFVVLQLHLQAACWQ